MRLFIRQKVFSWASRFTVKDEMSHDRYFVQGEIFSWGHKLHIYDANNREVALIQQKVFSFRPRYYVFADGRQIAEIVKEFSFFRPRYSILGLDWLIEGSAWQHDYRITQQGQTIVAITKEWFTWGDSYVLDIANPYHELMALAVTLTIDCVMAADDSAVT